MTGLDKDLATLLDVADEMNSPRMRAVVKRVEAELSRLREELDAAIRGDSSMQRTLAKVCRNAERIETDLRTAEARCARLQRQLDAVDAHLPPWETEPGSDVGCVGRVQTILNLRADRERCARLQQALDPETLARQFHETYERLAPEFGYETRRESAVPWEHVPEANRSLMIAVAAEIAREALAGQPAAAEGPDTPADCEHDYVFEVLPGEFDAALPYRCDKCGQRSPDGVKAADSPVCPCGHSADHHPAVWSIAGDATTACQVEGCGCDDYDGPPVPADSTEDGNPCDPMGEYPECGRGSCPTCTPADSREDKT